ncbi:hypothetical protein K469DRAFT_721441 [Zopfia rhizophila CBS 207.26]|uniref:Uncharacterized protein n=1 Tax=Zopfia rhizophila CBS 207.26 TaxID=1314779 RepID=A0A6A6EGX4_9PEZI|nr:hypothetical protein K469DRAFT_721441 [Zopfia rhizophila CBS 207.26]
MSNNTELKHSGSLYLGSFPLGGNTSVFIYFLFIYSSVATAKTRSSSIYPSFEQYGEVPRRLFRRTNALYTAEWSRRQSAVSVRVQFYWQRVLQHPSSL